MKARQENRRRRCEEERRDFTAVAEPVKNRCADQVGDDLKEAKNIGELEPDAGTEPVGGDHDGSGEWRVVEICGVPVGGADAEALGQMGVPHQEKSVS